MSVTNFPFFLIKNAADGKKSYDLTLTGKCLECVNLGSWSSILSFGYLLANGKLFDLGAGGASSTSVFLVCT